MSPSARDTQNADPSMIVTASVPAVRARVSWFQPVMVHSLRHRVLLVHIPGCPGTPNLVVSMRTLPEDGAATATSRFSASLG